MISQELIKHFDAVRVSNNDSLREGGWSSVPEIEQHKEFVGLKTVSVSTLNRLVKMKHVEKKANLYRVTSGGILFFDTQTGGGSPDGGYTPPDGYTPPEGQYTPPDGDQYPPKDYPQDDPRNPNYRTTSPEGGGGAPTGGVGVPIPAPIGGVTEGVIRNLM